MVRLTVEQIGWRLRIRFNMIMVMIMMMVMVMMMVMLGEADSGANRVALQSGEH